jgi:hypothetical protein
MKQVIIVVFCLAAGVLSAKAGEMQTGFPAAGGSPAFSQLAAQAQSVEAAPAKGFLEATAASPAFIPARATPVFTTKQMEEMDSSIGTAIAYVQAHNQGVYLLNGFECLRQNGTPEQKFAFVYQQKGTVYSFPDNCVMRNKGVLSDACGWVVETVCKMITYVSCKWVTSGDNPPLTWQECTDEAKEDCKEVRKWVCP